MIIFRDRDFAYPTVKDKLPVILTKVVDYVYRLRTEVDEKHGEVSLTSGLTSDSSIGIASVVNSCELAFH